MKLAMVGPAGQELPAVLDADGRLRDLSLVIGRVDQVFTDRGALERIARELAEGSLPAVEGSPRIGAPLRPGKILCIGLNYGDHAAETGADIPTEPILFMKAPDTVVGPTDDVLIPRGSRKTDWEVELAVVIGREARYLGADDDPMSYVAGYTVSNDVSERAFQKERGGQFDKGKNAETFCPMGPYFVTADEVPDPQNLRLTTDVNGVRRQDGTTADMIFGVAELVRYLSEFVVLRPGDVLNTGTPAGVAAGQPDPKPFLRPGDVMELSIEGLGTQRSVLRQG
ncbi:fumarylacetoacetate hydrolase family protein [Lysobacter korlensis]|uniref:Fumarylacetoacetate hydrolase family protein n=1 Tax=Lysobacter korlensis TaxID=553636 RepID=A0ABV6RZC5_9GAMM